MYIFDWDEKKNRANIDKHGLSFEKAQEAFFDPHRIVKVDAKHSDNEDRYYCIGSTGEGIATVRYTVRGNTIRIIGAGYWRKEKREYDEQDC